jgi:hypothetical protein
MTSFLDGIPWIFLIVLCLTLGLAPFVPEPHLVEKLKLLFSGGLNRPIDIFDLFMHATPFLLLLLKIVRHFMLKGGHLS